MQDWRQPLWTHKGHTYLEQERVERCLRQARVVRRYHQRRVHHLEVRGPPRTALQMWCAVLRHENFHLPFRHAAAVRCQQKTHLFAVQKVAPLPTDLFDVFKRLAIELHYQEGWCEHRAGEGERATRLLPQREPAAATVKPIQIKSTLVCGDMIPRHAAAASPSAQIAWVTSRAPSPAAENCRCQGCRQGRIRHTSVQTVRSAIPQYHCEAYKRHTATRAGIFPSHILWV